jgi:hypothetical protein
MGCLFLPDGLGRMFNGFHKPMSNQKLQNPAVERYCPAQAGVWRWPLRSPSDTTKVMSVASKRMPPMRLTMA